MNVPISAIREFVKFILNDPHKYKWTLQGFGMLRLHMNPNVRLHIWDSRYETPNVSAIHDHLQWGLRSLILSGEIQNTRFHRVSGPDKDNPFDEALEFNHARIKAGMGGGIDRHMGKIWLCPGVTEIYGPGEKYSQEPNEIHETVAEPGTITLMHKTPTDDTDGATVFWRRGEWVSAEPRVAETHAMEDICDYALEKLLREERESL